MPIMRSLEIVNATGGRVMLLDGDAGVQAPGGALFDPGHIIQWPLLAASVDTYVWTNPSGVWEVESVRTIISVSGGTSAVVDVRVCSGVTAPASGVTQLTATLDLEETAPAKATGTLIAVPTRIFPGDSVALDFGGTLTGLVGAITIKLKKVQ